MELQEGKFYRFIYGDCPTWLINRPDTEVVKLIKIKPIDDFTAYCFVYYNHNSIYTGTIHGCRQKMEIWAKIDELPWGSTRGTIVDIIPATEDEFVENKERALYEYYCAVHDAVEEMMFDDDNHI